MTFVVDFCNSKQSNCFWLVLFQILTPIKNQGDCGSCWALASVSVVESVNALANNSLRVASSEQVMDCVRPPAFQSRGCDGGAPLEAFDFVQRFGVASYTKYSTERAGRRATDSAGGGVGNGPSLSSATSLGTCHDVTLPADKLWIDFYQLGRRLSDSTIMSLVYRNGPIAALINAGDEDFTFYGEGVITSYGDTRFDTPYNHLVNIVGWGNDNGLDYWIIRNSWSQSWGESGFARLLRGINNRGINNFIVYAGATMRNLPPQNGNNNSPQQDTKPPPPVPQQQAIPSSSLRLFYHHRHHNNSFCLLFFSIIFYAFAHNSLFLP